MINRSELIIKPESFRLPTGSSILRELCVRRADVFNNARLAPGLFMPDIDYHLKARINGIYGLERFDIKTGETVAVCGFNLTAGEMMITHTPQGVPFPHGKKHMEDGVTSGARDRLVKSDFRIEMMLQMLEVARKLGIKSISGIPAALSTSVEIENLPYIDACKRIDDIYEHLGFVLADDCYYRLMLD